MADEEDVKSAPAETAEEKEITAPEVDSSEEKTEPETEEEVEDAAGEDTEEDVGEEPAETPEKPVGRAQARIQRQQEEIKAGREREERLISERATYAAQLEQLRQQQQETQSASQRKVEDERLASLSPDERALYQLQQQNRSLEHRLNRMEMQRMDDQDRANFHAKAAHDEVYKKYADDIEAAYQDGLKRDVRAPREELLAWKLGKELLKDRETKGGKKKETAGKRIETVTTKPVSARGGAAGSKTSKTEEDRLRGVLI